VEKLTAGTKPWSQTKEFTALVTYEILISLKGLDIKSQNHTAT
jgi:hypothetical protein